MKVSNLLGVVRLKRKKHEKVMLFNSLVTFRKFEV